MAKTEPVKSDHFVMVFDKDKYKVLNILVGLAMHDPVLLVKSAETNNVPHDVVGDFIGEMSDKSHELGWCEDPECEWEPNEKDSDEN